MESVIKAESDGQILTVLPRRNAECESTKPDFYFFPHKSVSYQRNLWLSLNPINFDDY